MRASLLGAGSVVALALAAGCSGDRDAAPPASPAPAASATVTNGPLVFARAVGDGASRRYELLRTDDRGTTATRFARRLFPDDQMAISPDGTAIAFTRPGPTGKGALRLAAPHDIFLARVGGGEATRLAQTRIDEHAPRFSHDGRWIAFSRPEGVGSGKVGLTSVADPGPVDVLSDPGDEYGWSWAPDTPRILYSHGSFLNGDYDLYVTNADTGEVTRVPGTSEYEGGVWTPAGSILVTTIDESTRPSETSLWLIAGDGSERRLVATTRGRLEYGFAFAPDASALALGLRFKNAGIRVAVFELGDTPVEATAEMGVRGWAPLWSPDGSTIAFLRGSGVWLMDVDGGNVRHVGGSRGAQRLVAWLAAQAG